MSHNTLTVTQELLIEKCIHKDLNYRKMGTQIGKNYTTIFEEIKKMGVENPRRKRAFRFFNHENSMHERRMS